MFFVRSMGGVADGDGSGGRNAAISRFWAVNPHIKPPDKNFRYYNYYVLDDQNILFWLVGEILDFYRVASNSPDTKRGEQDKYTSKNTHVHD